MDNMLTATNAKKADTKPSAVVDPRTLIQVGEAYGDVAPPRTGLAWFFKDQASRDIELSATFPLGKTFKEAAESKTLTILIYFQCDKSKLLTIWNTQVHPGLRPYWYLAKSSANIRAAYRAFLEGKTKFGSTLITNSEQRALTKQCLDKRSELMRQEPFIWDHSVAASSTATASVVLK